MPKTSKVGRLYDALVRSGKSKSTAAKIAQSRTGQALSTGKPFKKTISRSTVQ